MREIQPPKFKEYFSLKNKNSTFSDFYYYNQTIFNKFSLSTLLIIINLLLGIKIKICLIFALSTTFLLVYLYFKTQNESRNIIIKRKIPHFARELDQFSVEYTLSNLSEFTQENFYITDSFDGTESKINSIDFGNKIPKNTFIIKNKSYSLNAGMGVKNFGPLIITVSDPLDIFQFKIIEDKIETIKVYPQIEKIREMQIRGDQYALQFGLYDAPTRGDNTNFIGIRPYRPGDSIRRINWKLSLKTKKTILNEFEKNVNTTISIILNMDEKMHMGRGNLSTWEYAKDITLAVATRQLNNGNNVQFFSNDVLLASGSGQEHINFLELVICTLPLSKAEFSSKLIERSIVNISSESKLIYITPIFPTESFQANIDAIIHYSKFNSNIQVVIIDGSPNLAETIKGNSAINYQGLMQETQRQLQRILTDLKNNGIDCSIVKINTSISYDKQILDSLVSQNGDRA